ncbi:MAG TPA: POTRA domain-containing protein [Pyrinomonadaceae bacterium]|nr:POTRA domain-containing protein [Pyrinomonadaceae bacterium]
MNSSLFQIIVFLTLCVVPGGGSLHAQSYECSQPAQEREAIIREAEKNRYTTRRVEFVGHRYTGDQVLRRTLKNGLQEGDLFTRRNLVRNLRNLSRVKQLYPVNMRDVELSLNRPDQTIDMTICLRERKTTRQKRGG